MFFFICEVYDNDGNFLFAFGYSIYHQEIIIVTDPPGGLVTPLDEDEIVPVFDEMLEY